jgi:hypothetical protein
MTAQKSCTMTQYIFFIENSELNVEKRRCAGYACPQTLLVHLCLDLVEKACFTGIKTRFPAPGAITGILIHLS